METETVEKAAGVGAVGLWAALHGLLGWLVLLYAAVIMLDWLTGTALALKEKTWNSGKARQGLWHKCGSVITICVGVFPKFCGAADRHFAGPGAEQFSQPDLAL